ncbi:pentapeptide repeat-containing protein [Microcoleus sp. herbarium19]
MSEASLMGANLQGALLARAALSESVGRYFGLNAVPAW